MQSTPYLTWIAQTPVAAATDTLARRGNIGSRRPPDCDCPPYRCIALFWAALPSRFPLHRCRNPSRNPHRLPCVRPTSPLTLKKRSRTYLRLVWPGSRTADRGLPAHLTPRTQRDHAVVSHHTYPTSGSERRNDTKWETTPRPRPSRPRLSHHRTLPSTTTTRGSPNTSSRPGLPSELLPRLNLPLPRLKVPRPQRVPGLSRPSRSPTSPLALPRQTRVTPPRRRSPQNRRTSSAMRLASP